MGSNPSPPQIKKQIPKWVSAFFVFCEHYRCYLDLCNLLCATVHIPKFVRMRDSFAFSPLAKINDSPPSSWRRPSCPRQLGFYFRIPHLCKIKTRYPNGYLVFMAEDEGFEPPQTESESGVLPLHKSSIAGTFIIIRTFLKKSRSFLKKFQIF